MRGIIEEISVSTSGKILNEIIENFPEVTLQGILRQIPENQ